MKFDDKILCKFPTKATHIRFVSFKDTEEVFDGRHHYRREASLSLNFYIYENGMWKVHQESDNWWSVEKDLIDKIVPNLIEIER